MNINRNNYEEYFLLYADNELTDSEKVEVIMFLKQNKDLEEEFRMIHYTISKPDVSVTLGNKSFLHRENEESFINQKNYEEVFVLYHDNELTENEKLETEEFLSHHTELKKEFDLIGLARLTPANSVVFPGKRQLYRKEKTGKVAVLFRKALAAAVFIGFGLWMTQLYIRNEARKPDVAVQSVPTKKIVPARVVEKIVPPEKKPANTIVQSPGRNSQPSQTGINEKEKLQKSLRQKNPGSGPLVKTPVKTQNSDQGNVINQSPEIINDEVVIAGQQTKNIPGEQIPGYNQDEQSKELARDAIQTMEHVRPVLYAQNSSDVSDINDSGQNYVFYDITTEEFKKSKVGGFLKKVKRLIERNNPISRLISGEERQVASN